MQSSSHSKKNVASPSSPFATAATATFPLPQAGDTPPSHPPPQTTPRPHPPAPPSSQNSPPPPRSLSRSSQTAPPSPARAPKTPPDCSPTPDSPSCPPPDQALPPETTCPPGSRPPCCCHCHTSHIPLPPWARNRTGVSPSATGTPKSSRPSAPQYSFCTRVRRFGSFSGSPLMSRYPRSW